MVTTPLYCFAISLLAVTFGWAPVDPSVTTNMKPALPSDDGPASGYEYHVRVSPTDLEDLRAGRVDSLSSHLPDDVGPIERVRITFGEGPAPRERTAVDRRSKTPASDGQRYVVAKPATPEWGPAPKRHVAYQNPNPTTLEQGFQEAAEAMGVDQQQAEEWVRTQAREMADSSVDSGIQLAQAYVGTPPGATPYGTRPTQGTVNNGNNYQTVPPPTPTSTVNNGAPNYNTTPTYNTNGTPNYNNTNTYGTTNNGATGSTQLALPPPPGTTAPVPRSTTNNGFETNPYNTATTPNQVNGPTLATPQGRPVLERFTNDSELYGPTGATNVTPVRQNDPMYRSPTPTGTSSVQYRSNNTTGSQDVWGGNGAGNQPLETRQTSTNFPERAPLNPPPFDSNTTRGQSPRNTTRTDYERGRDASSEPGDSWLNPTGDTSRDRARDNDYARLGDDDATRTEVIDNTRYIETLVIVILCAVTFFTWTSYLDIRNKYRAALRGAPTAGGLAA